MTNVETATNRCRDAAVTKYAKSESVSYVTRHSAFGIPSCLGISCFVILLCMLPIAGATGSASAPARAAATCSAATAESQPRILASPFASPRQLLRLLDIGESDLSSFRDGQPIGPDDQEALIKILYRMPQIGGDEIDRWQHTDVSWTSLRTDPSSARGPTSSCCVDACARSVRQALTPRLASLFDFDHFYQLDVELDDAQGTAVVFTRTVPRAWEDRAQLDERTRTAAMFVKVGDERDGVPSLMFVGPAHRVAAGSRGGRPGYRSESAAAEPTWAWISGCGTTCVRGIGCPSGRTNASAFTRS